ncbi:NADH dehydrogenase [ubiquinone] 1 subunit C2-like [Penaeus monodon]|uniref:NADH dehydrogenase [ubiquinone] 1 subunit C2-like n=1 Tax=Penaeus monodon TaxID=6687 RepID=UPI0018A6D563|nr:NADH dehydrogenase [ubiquinone] 1 subunit C2-like [Penaeus monodon]
MEVEEATEINPADYFNPDRSGPNPGVLRKAWYPTLFTGVGIGLACFVNAFNKKPVFSGAQQHAIGAAVGLVFGISAEKWIQRKAAHRDAVIYQYIVSHPEDFAPIERKKYADVLEKWVPMR